MNKILKTIVGCLGFIYLSVCLAQIGITQQKVVSQKGKEKHMNTEERFDIKKFNKHENGSEWVFSRADGFTVRQIDMGDFYAEDVNKLYSPFVFRKSYNKKGYLILKGTWFYGTSIGEWLSYNDQGEVIKTINYDEPYKLSINDLAVLMKKNHQLDILDESKTYRVSRYIDEQNTHQPLYEVYAYAEDGKVKNWYDSYLIEGNTGKLLFKIKLFSKGDKGLYNEYIKSTKEFASGVFTLKTY